MTVAMKRSPDDDDEPDLDAHPKRLETVELRTATHPKAVGDPTERELAHTAPSEGELSYHLDWDLREGQ